MENTVRGTQRKERREGSKEREPQRGEHSGGAPKVEHRKRSMEKKGA